MEQSSPSPREGNRGIATQGSLYRLNCLGRSLLVAMMQTSRLREFNNISHLGWLNGARCWGVFGQPQVSPAAVIIFQVAF
jgi:hypothetical protein